MAKAKVSSSKLKRYLLLVPIIFAFLVGSWFLISPQIFAPAGINELSVASKDIIYGIPESEALPAGCFYKQNQCVAAPCPPRLVCTSPLPTSIPVPPNANCRLAYPSCPQPICGPDGLCTKVACEPVMVCESPRPTPISSSVPTSKPSPTSLPTCKPQPPCLPGQPCRMTASTEYCQIVKPTPTTQTGSITTFSVSGACGTDSFNTYGYTCKNGARNNFTGCQTIQSAMAQVLQACSGIK